MLRRIHDRNILLVYGVIFLLGVAYGVSIALTALHLDARAFSKHDIGTLAAWFASGIVAFSLPMGALIRRFSARTILTVALVGYAASVTTFPLLGSYGAIAAARFLDGAFSVAVWVSSETILLARSGRHNKAYVTSLYAVSMAIGYVVGPIAARGIVAIASMPVAFATSGGLALIASIVSAAFLERGAASAEPSRAEDAARVAVGEGLKPAKPLSAVGILARTKTSCFATFAYGYFQSSVVLFLPLFLVEEKAIARERTILVPAFFAAGMLLFSNYAGRVADRLGHLAVMRVLAVVGGAMVASFVFLDGFASMSVAVFVAGASLASISPVSLALQGAVVDPASYGRSNGIYNAFYATGMLVGPPASSAIYARYSGAGMLGHLAALWAAFVVFTVIFWKDDPASARRSAAVASPSSAPTPSTRADAAEPVLVEG